MCVSELVATEGSIEFKSPERRQMMRVTGERYHTFILDTDNTHNTHHTDSTLKTA